MIKSHQNIKIYPDGIIEILIPDFIKIDAREKAQIANVENKYSLYKGESNKYVNELSNLSEMCFHYVFPSAQYDSTIHYDFKWFNKKVDIKCKKAKYKPYNTFVASVLQDQYFRQQNEVYVFVRVREDFNVCWILGAYNKKKFLNDSELSIKGTINKSTGYVTKENSYDLPIGKLIRLDKYIEWSKIND